MKTKIYLAAFAALWLTACSGDETVNNSSSENAITVTAAVGATGRASEAYCPEVAPRTFLLSAVHVNSVADGENGNYEFGDYYFDAVSMARTVGSFYDYADGHTRYWPKNNLAFYAWYSAQDVTLSPVESMANPGQTTMMFENFTVSPNATEQADLLYAFVPNATRNQDVRLQFRHALSQVVFSARCLNRNLKIEISKVGIGGLHSTGNFYWDGGSYRDAMYNESRAGENSSQNGYGSQVLVPSWVPASAGQTADATYMIALKEPIIISAADANEEGEIAAKPLTNAPENHYPNTLDNGSWDWSNWHDVLQLLPQQSSHQFDSMLEELVNLKRSPAKMTTAANYSGSTSALVATPYIILQARITTTNDDGSEVVLYSNVKDGADQLLYIPISIGWNPGVRYNYTITFGEGTGGGYPEVPDDDDVDPVLTNIGINISVKEYEEIATAQEQQGDVLTLL